MNCCVQDLKYKDVVSINDGMRLGCVNDVEIETDCAKVCSIIIYGKLKWFGLLGREEDIVIGWDKIKLIGEDTILVDFCCPCRKKGFMSSLSSMFT